jgi:serine/threonine protein phosphatase 1
MNRTFAIGDIHGDLDSLDVLLGRLPRLGEGDTLVFVGDYLDRGPKSRQVIERLRGLPAETSARIVVLRGNHEDAWLRVIDRGGWLEFILPRENGCLETKRSFCGEPVPAQGEPAKAEDVEDLYQGTFFPADVVEWMRSLPHFYEDEHAIYVHAGLTKGPTGFTHPADVDNPAIVLWCRDHHFFTEYVGKLVVFGHTSTDWLPQELSTYTPADPTDVWVSSCAIGLDTGCGKGGFLTAIELPARNVYESR